MLENYCIYCLGNLPSFPQEIYDCSCVFLPLIPWDPTQDLTILSWWGPLLSYSLPSSNSGTERKQPGLLSHRLWAAKCIYCWGWVQRASKPQLLCKHWFWSPRSHGAWFWRVLLFCLEKGLSNGIFLYFCLSELLIFVEVYGELCQYWQDC